MSKAIRLSRYAIAFWQSFSFSQLLLAEEPAGLNWHNLLIMKNKVLL